MAEKVLTLPSPPERPIEETIRRPDPSPSRSESPSPKPNKSPSGRSEGPESGCSATEGPAIEDPLEGYEIPEGFRERDRADESEGGDRSAAAGDRDAAPAEVYLSPDAFHALFCELVTAPNMIVRPALRSLELASKDPSSRKASDALYEICLETPYLRWILSPATKWGQRAAALAGFGALLFASVKMELDERRQAAERDAADARQASRQAANEDATHAATVQGRRPPPASENELKAEARG